MKRVYFKCAVVLIFLVSCKNSNAPEINSVTVVITPENSGVVTPGQDTLVERGTILTLSSAPNEGYVFSGWSGSIVSQENPLSITVTEDIDLVAEFTKKTYPLNIEVTGEGSVTETIVQAKTDYEHGTLVLLQAVPDSGWKFTGWGGDLQGEEESVTVEVTSEMNITANFEISSFPLTITVLGNGNVEESLILPKTDYEYGTVVELAATPDTMWVFRGWSGDVVDENHVIRVEVTSAMNITATFEEGVIDYCVPVNLDAYRQKSVGDSIRILDWDFTYEGRFIKRYSKYIEYTRTGNQDLFLIRGTMSYSDNLISDYEARTVISGIRDSYAFEWEGNQLSKLDYYYSANAIYNQKSTSIVYEEPCGLELFDGEQGEQGTDDHAVFSYDYQYTNNCKTYSVGISDFEITYSTESSIFKDVEGIPGFLGALYEDMIFTVITIPLPNKNDYRLQKSIVGIPGRHQVGLAIENYDYSGFIKDEDYPRYFTRSTTYTESSETDFDTFTVRYYCGYK